MFFDLFLLFLLFIIRATAVFVGYAVVGGEDLFHFTRKKSVALSGKCALVAVAPTLADYLPLSTWIQFMIIEEILAGLGIWILFRKSLARTTALWLIGLLFFQIAVIMLGPTLEHLAKGEWPP